MKIFLTGATGVIGKRAVRQLVAAGHVVTGVARSESKAADLRGLGGRPVRVSLFDPAALTDAVRGHDAVVNLATNIPSLDRALDPAAWATNNRLRTEASVHLTRAAAAGGCRTFVQESITFPYADRGEAWIDEAAPIARPAEMASSGVAEEQTAWFTQAGGCGIVLRFALFYADDSSHTQAFRAALRAGDSPFVGSPEAYMSHIHADDAAAAVVSALRAPAGVYNVADDRPLPRAELARIAATVEGVSEPRPPAPLEEDAPGILEALARSQRISNARFKKHTGWVARYPSLREGWRQLLGA